MGTVASGEWLTLREWARREGLSYQGAYSRYSAGGVPGARKMGTRIYVPAAAHCPRKRPRDYSGVRYRVDLCGRCHHPGGQHIIESGCRLCRDCTGWDETNSERGLWSDRLTGELLAALEDEGPRWNPALSEARRMAVNGHEYRRRWKARQRRKRGR